MGARNGGNPHAACDVEGAGDVVWVGTPGPHRRASPRPYCAADGGQRKSNRARLLRPDTCEATEQREATPGGSRGGKGLTQGEQPLGGRGSDTEPNAASIRMMAARRASARLYRSSHDV